MQRRWTYQYGNWFFLSLLIAFASCKKPYLPPVVVATNSFLVVEGVVNAGSDSTFIKLSRTVKLSDSTTLKQETGATVSVVGESSAYLLTEKGNGVYVHPGLRLNASQKYRLKINTAGGKEYLSDAVAVKVTPAIDSISYVIKPNGIDINTSAHDPTNNTRYYRWDYDETWRFHSKFISRFVAQGDVVVPRTPDGQVYYCFANNKSSTIVIGNTVKLANDVVSNINITNIPATSEKISVRYSINLRQYALSRESYEFWENIKKNTEQLGSVFDALPTEIKGNIHCISDPNEPVIGYLDVSTVSSKRIFIDEAQLPNYQTIYPFDCEEAPVLYNNKGADEVSSNILNGLYIPTMGIYSVKGDLLGYQRTARPCADCTVRGFTKQPDFWK